MTRRLPRSPRSSRSTRSMPSPTMNLSAKLADFKRRIRKTPIAISGATGKGVDAAMKALLKTIDTDRTRRSR